MDGIQHLRRAKELLVDTEAQPRARVEAAAKEFWSALFHCGEAWPLELRRTAQFIQRRILAKGTIQWTLQRMTTAEIEQTAGQLLQFIAAAEQIKTVAEGTQQKAADRHRGPLQS